MAKEVVFHNEAKQKILKGIEKISNAVKVTLGPKGRNVILRKPRNSTITKDGVSVAKEISFKDQCEDVGAQMIKDIADKTATQSGDGTTTATVLAEAIYKEGLKNITAGADPMMLKAGIENMVTKVIKHIKDNSKKISLDNLLEVEQVATIASNGDENIGKLIAEAFSKVGKDGVITIGESKTGKTELSLVEGMEIDRGYISPYFITDKEKLEVILENPYILMTEKKISNIKEIIPIIEKILNFSPSSPLVIFADDLEGEALSTLIVNKLQGRLNISAAKAPSYGPFRKAYLEDLAILTGGVAITTESGIKLENLELESLGKAKSIKMTKDNTTILQGLGDSAKIEERVNYIKNELELVDNDLEKEKLRERLARLTNGVAVINVGALTEIEMKEKKDRIEDALHATKAALEEGIVPGGGVALLKASFSLVSPHIMDDILLGENIVRNAIQAPIKQLCKNAGQEGLVIIEYLQDKEFEIGYDVKNNTYVNMFSSGIIDPAKVTRIALENASGVASLLLTTEAIVIDELEKE